MVQSLAKPASPLMQAQSFYCATLIRGPLHMPNHIRCDGSSHTRKDYCIKLPLKPPTALGVIYSCAVTEYSLCI